MMKRNVFALLAQMGVASVVGITGCAGTLTNDDEILFCQTHPSACMTGSGTGATTGTMPTGTTTTTGGAMPDPCITTAFKSCQTDGCHQGVAVAASLTLDNTAISTAAGAKALIGKKNSADPNYPAACMAGMYNLIDSAAPDMSLLYTKLADPPICGMRMPQIGAALKATDKTCVLNWINSVIALP